jgi:hypothetical protein
MKICFFAFLLIARGTGMTDELTRQAALADDLATLVNELVARHGESQRSRIERGVKQVAALWNAADGDERAMAAFARESFIPDSDRKTLDATLARFEYALEQIDGHFNEIGRELKHWSELDVGPMLPIDRVFAAFDPWAHLTEDMFRNKAAFVVLLNFPVTTLAERIEHGPRWSRRQWAEARLAARFAKRVPAEVNQLIAKAQADGDAYIAEYNIWMHHVLDKRGQRLFPSGKRLISHWNLRDELKANYAEADGLAKQHIIAQIMERIVEQSIPQVVINNPRVDWFPSRFEQVAAPEETIEANAPPPMRRLPARACSSHLTRV